MMICCMLYMHVTHVCNGHQCMTRGGPIRWWGTKAGEGGEGREGGETQDEKLVDEEKRDEEEAVCGVACRILATPSIHKPANNASGPPLPASIHPADPLIPVATIIPLRTSRNMLWVLLSTCSP